MRFEWECRNLIPLPLAHAVSMNEESLMRSKQQLQQLALLLSDLESVACEGLNTS
jgi:hypothetical protein